MAAILFNIESPDAHVAPAMQRKLQLRVVTAAILLNVESLDARSALAMQRKLQFDVVTAAILWSVESPDARVALTMQRKLWLNVVMAAILLNVESPDARLALAMPCTGHAAQVADPVLHHDIYIARNASLSELLCTLVILISIILMRIASSPSWLRHISVCSPTSSSAFSVLALL